jgi:glutaredoxin
VRRYLVPFLTAIALSASFGAVASGGEPPAVTPPSASAAAPHPPAAVVVVIYGASWCGPCHQTADYLKSRGVAFVMKDIEQTPGADAEMRRKLAGAGVRGGAIPVIDVRGEILVGFDPGALAQALAKAGIAATPVAATGGTPAPAGAAGSLRKMIAAVGDTIRAARARNAIVEMDLAAAKGILDGVDPSDAALAIETARLAIYTGDYDGAAAILSRSDLMATSEGAELGDIARGCARGMAGTLEVRDDARGVILHLQDDDDRALAPVIAETAVRARAQLAKDLGVELARPLRIDLVRDQFTLAAMTGLPEEAARTTGTVAVAKWGRVTMLTPRAMSHGYPWLDTLAHEMTHLALSQGTRDLAPLWLQEGVAKREEIRWREAEPLDDVPSPDVVALVGMERGLGRSLDRLGPSIAMLPTAEEAAVAFAEVTSFIRYWTKEVGDDGLPQLVIRLKSAPRAEDVDRSIQEVSGADLAGWDKRWRAHLALGPHELPPDLAPGAALPHSAEISKRGRLGELFEARGHHQAAAIELGRAEAFVPADATLRAWLAVSLLGTGDKANASMLVDKVDDLHSRYGRWWSLHGLLHPEKASFAFGLALAQDPLDPWVSCEEKAPPELPSDPIRLAICEAARRAPR